MSYTEKVILDWERLAKDCDALAQKIKDSGKVPQKMLAITRGGLGVATVLSRSLNIKDIETIGLESYHGQEQSEEVKVIKDPDSRYTVDTLIVDDLVDTGKTFEYLKSRTTNCVFACVYAKPKGKEFTDFHVADFEQHEWIEFPWEPYEK